MNIDDIAPANTYAAITPSDTVDMTPCRGIYVGGDGDIVAVSEADAEITFTAAVAGSVLPIRAKRVNATGTTATDLVALY